MVARHFITAGNFGSERIITVRQALIVAALTFAVAFYGAGYLFPASAVRATLKPQAASAPGAISADAAQSHIGQAATVEGVVSNVYTARSGSATFIDMGGPYPFNAFTGVIFAGDAARIGNVHGLSGKTVDLTGTISLYHGRPEIILRTPDQIATR